MTLEVRCETRMQAAAKPLPESVPGASSAWSSTYDLWAGHEASGATDTSKVPCVTLACFGPKLTPWTGNGCLPLCKLLLKCFPEQAVSLAAHKTTCCYPAG